MNPAIRDALLYEWTFSGLWFSLHEFDPNGSGEGELFGAPRLLLDGGWLEVLDGQVVLLSDSEIETATAAGVATYYGLWIDESTFLIGAPLVEIAQLTVGQRYAVAAGQVLIDWAL